MPTAREKNCRKIVRASPKDRRTSVCGSFLGKNLYDDRNPHVRERVLFTKHALNSQKNILTFQPLHPIFDFR